MSPPRKTAAQWLEQALSLMASNPDASMSCIERAIEMAPSNAQAWFYKASVHHRAGRDADALAAFQKTAELDGGTAPAINGIVVCLKRLRRFAEAKAAAESCRDQSHFNLRAGYADLFKVEDVVKAMALLLPCETLAKDDGERGLFHYNKACYESLMLRHDDAIASLTKAIQLAPKYKAAAPKDPDFAIMLGDPRFRALTA